MRNGQFPFTYPILIGDIGGTNARFACLTQDGRFVPLPSQKTKHFRSIEQALVEVIWPMLDPKPQSVIFAIAGPVNGDILPLTNCHWQINVANLQKIFNLQTIFILNDFEAQALASLAFTKDQLLSLDNLAPGLSPDLAANPAPPMALRAKVDAVRANECRLILGPGTGLGVAALLCYEGCYIPVAGEGGHIDYAPLSLLDFELYPFLRLDKSRISAEELLSGRGLVTIYRAFCHYSQQMINFQNEEEISSAAQKGDAVAGQAVCFFLDYLARFAGDLALIFKAQGGVYIAGGIVPRFLSLLDGERFRSFFESKYPHQNWLAKIPIHIILEQEGALKGIEYFLAHFAKFIMPLNHRLWSFPKADR